jgi:hypothetical protein
MVPILEPLDDRAAAHAADLGVAFQLSNFIRDVGEDLRRGRVYLPQEDVDRFGVTRADLARGVATPPVRELLRFEVARTRELYARARPGVDMLHPSSRECIRTAFVLYGGILDEVERVDYDVLRRRVRVPLSRRLRVALPAYARTRRARLRAPRLSDSREPYPPTHRLHDESEAEEQILDRGERQPRPEDRALVVHNDVEAGEYTVADQLEEQHDRVRDPEHAADEQPSTQHDQVQQHGEDDGGDRQGGVSHR